MRSKSLSVNLSSGSKEVLVLRYLIYLNILQTISSKLYFKLSYTFSRWERIYLS
jgi:hypothetical protein